MKKDDMERQEAYEREIEEMHARVENAPLLVEQFMAENAKTAAEKKFIATLHKSGLNDKEFVTTKSSRPSTSVRSGVTNITNGPNDVTPSLNNNNDLTYTKSDLADD
uniref:Uncharacterized protein n=1 Tax=Arion vulgaris TaxID=1028688 RepID=A0A0B7AN95_9EUPU